MFNTEEFQTNLKAIADNTPDKFRSTIGGVVHWTIGQAFLLHFYPRLLELETRIEELELLLKDTEDANEQRGLQESQGNEEIPTKATRRRKE